MGWLYDGMPDRPRWLARWIEERPKRQFVREVASRPPDFSAEDLPPLSEELSAIYERAGRRRRREKWRRRLADVITDPVVVWPLDFIGATLTALQLDRILDGDPATGSALRLVLGLSLIWLGIWLARSRAAEEAKQTDINETRWLLQRFEDIREEVHLAQEGVVDEVTGVVADEVRRLDSEISALRERLDEDDGW